MVVIAIELLYPLIRPRKIQYIAFTRVKRNLPMLIGLSSIEMLHTYAAKYIIM